MLTPLVFVILVPTWVVISKATKTAALASLIVLCAIPVGVWVTGRKLWEIPAQSESPSLSLFVTQAIFGVCEAALNSVSDQLQLKFSKQFREVITVETRQMTIDDIVEQLLPYVMSEKEATSKHDIVQQEEPVCLFKNKTSSGLNGNTEWYARRNCRNRGSNMVWAP